MNLMQLLQERGGDILREAYQMMSRARLKNYEAAGVQQIQQRLQALYELVTRSVAERNLVPMRMYAKAIATERFEAGFDLWEVQTAFNVLEETIWKCILNEMQPEQYAEALSLVSTVLGTGKDTLARTYVALASKTKTPVLNVQYLFNGPEGF